METIMNEENKISAFALKTREVLDHNVTDNDGNKLYKNKNVEQNGFAVFGEKQDVILLLGMNPAGDDNDAANQYGKHIYNIFPATKILKIGPIQNTSARFLKPLKK